MAKPKITDSKPPISLGIGGFSNDPHSEVISVSDYVIVPVGKDDHHSVAEVAKVEYFWEERVPLPLDRTNHIIRMCTDDNFDPPNKE